MQAIVVDWKNRRVYGPQPDAATAKRVAESQRSSREVVMSVSAVPAAVDGDNEQER